MSTKTVVKKTSKVTNGGSHPNKRAAVNSDLQYDPFQTSNVQTNCTQKCRIVRLISFTVEAILKKCSQQFIVNFTSTHNFSITSLTIPNKNVLKLVAFSYK